MGSSPAIPPTPPAAWADSELVNPHAHADKPAKVRGMFAAIARSYDLNNRLHSLGLDRRWRRAAVRRAQVRAGDHVLDVACGTGALTEAFAPTPAARIVGLDFTPEMLDIARRKAPRLPQGPGAKPEYLQGDAMHLPFEDRSFDVVSIAFGIRNVADPREAIREFARVLRPGGRLVILEFDRPRSRLIAALNDVYVGRVMPRTATLISGDRTGAYKYLPASVSTFLSRDEMLKAMSDHGFREVSAQSLTFGMCACYRGVRE